VFDVDDNVDGVVVGDIDVVGDYDHDHAHDERPRRRRLPRAGAF